MSDSARSAIAELTDSFPRDVVISDEARTSKYRQDRARDPRAGQPLAVVRAESTSDVQDVMRWATRHRIGVVPRGAGTGLSGGATARDDCIVLSTERMRTFSIDSQLRIATTQPGLLNGELKEAVAAEGLWYPPDPSSFEICSIGGNIATNAGGLCCVKYGVTSDYVLGVEVVLSDGTAVQLGGARLKDSAGLSLTKLFVGSEGTLGIVTEATLRLMPKQPETATAVATFASAQAATAAVTAVTSRIRPAMLEFMDRVSINAVEDLTRMGLDRTAAAMLIAQTDAGGEAGEHELAQIVEEFRKSGASELFETTDPVEGSQFVAARRLAIPAVEARGSLLLEDVGVSLRRLPDLVTGIEHIARRQNLEIALVAHAGDGNAHPLIIFDASDSDHARRAELGFAEIMALAISLGGTITGEHGVGRLKRPWLVDQVGPDVLELSNRIKRAIDPCNLLNPGAVF